VHTEAQRLIAALGMQPHPEGGWYRETYRSPDTVTTARGTRRSATTSIYFLLTSAEFSAFHRLASDEAWHFYRGDPVTIEIVSPSGAYTQRTLGVGDALQATVPANAYFASHVDAPDSYALVGCDVSPGFDFADFELTPRAMLIAAYPQHAALIARYTR
jgi:predicted cupin superfamily sugar epimerase